jgi:hypothetical protein
MGGGKETLFSEVAGHDGRGNMHMDTAASQLGLSSTRSLRPGLLESICEAYGRQS